MSLFSFFSSAQENAIDLDQARVNPKDPNMRYYRLKAVDMNGSFEASDLIAGKSCMNASLLQSAYQEGTVVHVMTNHLVTVQLVNNKGQVLLSGTSEEFMNFESSQFAKGLYQVVLTGADGTKEMESVMVT